MSSGLRMKNEKIEPKIKKLKAKSKKPAFPTIPAFNILDLGCGLRKRPGAIGIDVNPRSQADIMHDLNRFPYPFPDNHFDNIIEHLDDFLKVMEELHRVAKPPELVTTVVPFYSHQQAHTDLTQGRFFGVHSFD